MANDNMRPAAPPFTTQDADRLLGLADQFLSDWADDALQGGNRDLEYEERNAEWGAIRAVLVQAPAMLQLLRDARGAMASMRHQIDQMSGMFNDADGTIQAACDDHDDIENAIAELVAGIEQGGNASAALKPAEPQP